MLWAIWFGSVVMVGLALTIVVCLVMVRVVGRGWAAGRERQQAALLETLLAWLDGRHTDEEAHAALTVNIHITIELLTRIFEIIRGEDQERLAALADDARIPLHLRRMLKSRAVIQRLTAAETLVWFPSDETRWALHDAVGDPVPDVRLAAGASLARLGEKLPMDRLLTMRQGPGAESSRRLEEVLIRAAPRQIDDLGDIACDSSRPGRARAGAIEAMAQTGTFDVVAPIAMLAGSLSPAVRTAVAHALGVLRHPDGSKAITKLLDDPRWEVRAEAAEAVGRIGLVPLTRRLMLLLTDEAWWVRFRAGESLADLGAPGLEALQHAATSGNAVASRMAQLVLAERGLS